MRQLLLSILLFGSISSAAQSNDLGHVFKKDKCILSYSYLERNDSSLVVGHLREKKTNAPVSNVNIHIKNFPIGTVSDPNGNFKLFLPRREGTIVFDKTGFTYFEFPYKYIKEDLKVPSAHH